MKAKNRRGGTPVAVRRGGPAISRKKTWAFRLALLLSPLVLLAALEITLRLVGFGYPAAFLIPSKNNGEKNFIQNNQFGWRFFGRRMAREPAAISIARHKMPGTVRIFIFGESAAFRIAKDAASHPRGAASRCDF